MAYPKYVSVFLIREESGFRTYLSVRSGSSTYNDHWQNPGGKREFLETPLAAAQREVLEETGLNLASGRFVDLGRASVPPHAGGPYSVTGFMVLLKPEEIPQQSESKSGPWIPIHLGDVSTLKPIVPAIRLHLTKLLSALAPMHSRKRIQLQRV